MRISRVRSNRKKDNHHLFFTRKSWGYGAYNKLRLFHYCIVPIPRETLHRYIHTNLEAIPVPDMAIAEEVLQKLQLLDYVGVLKEKDPIEKRLRLLAKLFDGKADLTANALRKELDLVYRFKEMPP